MAFLFCTGFEHGSTNTTPLGSGITDPFFAAASNITIDGTTFRTGNYALKVAPTASADSYGDRFLTVSIVNTAHRGYMRFSTLPTGEAEVWREIHSIAGDQPNLSVDGTNNRWVLKVASGSVNSSGVTPQTGVWHRIEIHVFYNSGAARWEIDWYIDGVAQSQLVAAGTTAAATRVRWGTTSTAGPAYTGFVDDWVVFQSAQPVSEWPPGDGVVRGLSPTGMGTHVNEADFQDDGGGAIDSNDYTRVDDVPMTSTTDFIEQITVGSTSYIELTFADWPDSTNQVIDGAWGWVTAHGSAAGANNGWDVNALYDATEVIIISAGSTDVGGTAISSGGATIGVTSVSEVDSLKMRFGYAPDVVPIPRFDAFMIEVSGRVGGGADHWAWAEGSDDMDSWQLVG